MTSKKSFEQVKGLIESIEINNFPYLKIIIVLTKEDLADKKEINSDELQEFMNTNSSFQNEEISSNSKDNLPKLLKYYESKKIKNIILFI